VINLDVVTKYYGFVTCRYNEKHKLHNQYRIIKFYDLHTSVDCTPRQNGNGIDSLRIHPRCQLKHGWYKQAQAFTM